MGSPLRPQYMSHCQHVSGPYDPSPCHFRASGTLFLMIINVYSRCWAGKLSSSSPSANKHVRRENLEDDDKVALSPSSTPRELHTAPSFCIRVHVEAILMCLSCAISVSLFPPQFVAQSTSQTAIYHHHESLEAVNFYIVLFSLKAGRNQH